MQPAIFLDRDGVIIHNRAAYIRSWDHVKLYPHALKALIRLSASSYQIILVTNQSAVGRGLIKLETVEEINTRLMLILQENGARVDGIYICPHSPEDQCNCRKPLPGLLLKAASEKDIDLQQSILIGDALSDLQAGRSAGVNRLILVQTGRGNRQLKLPGAASLQPFEVYKNLYQAVIHESLV